MAWHQTDIAADGAGPRASRALSLGGHDLFVAGWEGGWFAVEDRCSHAGCAFSEDGEVDGPRVVCNCHGSEFDLKTGEPLHGPATRPLATFPTRVAEGVLEIEM
jgi:nitrite reductase/ring-hydroxylating ferredoxin subunit